MSNLQANLTKAAQLIKNAGGMVITAGAGLGVDSGLPDFRGPEGFWKAYPPYRKKGLVLPDVSTPHWFRTDPHFAWGFYGHRYNLYHNTKPHAGFSIMKEWSKEMEIGYFVFTSNVDGHFQKAGYDDDRIVECHGTCNFLQTLSASSPIWKVPDDFIVNVEDETFRAKEPLPIGPPDVAANRKSLARPNILMFNDMRWNGERTDKQYERMNKWLNQSRKLPIVVIEIGAGLYVPTVRYLSEEVVGDSVNKTTCLIRINPNESQVDSDINHISIPLKALDAINKINELLMDL